MKMAAQFLLLFCLLSVTVSVLSVPVETVPQPTADKGATEVDEFECVCVKKEKCDVAMEQAEEAIKLLTEAKCIESQICCPKKNILIPKEETAQLIPENLKF